MEKKSERQKNGSDEESGMGSMPEYSTQSIGEGETSGIY